MKILRGILVFFLFLLAAAVGLAAFACRPIIHVTPMCEYYEYSEE